jgi:hypothetical protein
MKGKLAMNNMRRMAWCAAVALVALLAVQADARAGTFSVKVFNNDGSSALETISLTVTDSANNVLVSQISSSGIFTFTVTSAQTQDRALTFSFNRGTTTVIISGIDAQASTPATTTMSVVVPK